MAIATSHTQTPIHTNGRDSSQIVIYEDVPHAAERLKEELAKWHVAASICQSMHELEGIVTTLDKAMFAIDIDMGLGRRKEGLNAIRYLKKRAAAESHSFYVTALTSHVEHRLEAAQAGVDAFVVKTSTETDALELLTRLRVHNIALEKEAAAEPQSILAEREYREIERQLKSRSRLKRGLASPLDTIQRALNWPFLLPNEQLILTALHEQLSTAQSEGKIDKKIMSLCLEGVAMLIDNRGQDAPVEEWLRRAREESAGFMLNWLDEEYFDHD